MNEEDVVQKMQDMIDYRDRKYKEECRDRTGITIPFAVICFFLVVGVIIAAILTCVFG